MGTRQTLKYMRDAVRASVRNPAMVVRNTAIEITRGCASRDFRCEMESIYEWVRDNIRFVRDIHGVETVATPERTLDLGVADCDDSATLMSALLEAVGHPTRFVAIGFFPGQFSHVFTETRLGDRWIPLEATVPGAHIGWYPPHVRARMVQKIQSY